MQSLASLRKADAYDSEVRDMEAEEQHLLLALGNTTRQNKMLMDDLSRRSVELSNSLVPRNKIKPGRSPKYVFE